MRLSAWLTLAVVSCALPALAQDDDLAPMPVPTKKDPKKAAPAKKGPAPTAKKGPVTPKKPANDEELAPTPVPTKGEVLVKLTTPLTNALLNIDGKELGPLTATPQLLGAGEHTVVVRRVGFANFVKKVTVTAGKTIEIEAKLTAMSAVLSVTSDVAGAQVYLDGKLLGPAPITDYEAAPKAVEVVVRKDGFGDEKRAMTLVAGKDFPVAVKLTAVAKPVSKPVSKPVAMSDTPVAHELTPVAAETPITIAEAPSSTPLYGRWYFWAGVGAVVVAGAATAIGVSVYNNQTVPLTEKQICLKNDGKCSACVGFTCSGPAAATGVMPWGNPTVVHF